MIIFVYIYIYNFFFFFFFFFTTNSAAQGKMHHTCMGMNYGCNYFLSEYFHGPMISCQAFASQAARQHYNMQLKKKVWLGWHSLVQKHWKVKVEQACQARAEEVCTRLSADYEAKLAEVNRKVDPLYTNQHVCDY